MCIFAVSSFDVDDVVDDVDPTACASNRPELVITRTSRALKEADDPEAVNSSPLKSLVDVVPRPRTAADVDAAPSLHRLTDDDDDDPAAEVFVPHVAVRIVRIRRVYFQSNSVPVRLLPILRGRVLESMNEMNEPHAASFVRVSVRLHARASSQSKTVVLAPTTFARTRTRVSVVVVGIKHPRTQSNQSITRILGVVEPAHALVYSSENKSKKTNEILYAGSFFLWPRLAFSRAILRRYVKTTS